MHLLSIFSVSCIHPHLAARVGSVPFGNGVRTPNARTVRGVRVHVRHPGRTERPVQNSVRTPSNAERRSPNTCSKSNILALIYDYIRYFFPFLDIYIADFMIYVTVRLLWRSEFEPSSNRSVQVQGASPNRTSVRFAFRQKGPRTELNRTEPSLAVVTDHSLTESLFQ